MLVIGIVGGVASGKSFVAEYLRELGAIVVNVDRVGHEVLRWPEVEAAVRQRWGQIAFGTDGHVDRSALSRIVFAPPPEGPEQLAYLEQITHPRIAATLTQRIESARAEARAQAVVLDAAVLLKAGWDRFCDLIVFVDAPRDVRLQRAGRRGWTEGQFEAREAAQCSLGTKRERADLVIDSSRSRQQIYTEIERFWTSLSQ